MKHTVLEYCYKDDALGDPLVNDYHIYAMGIATKEELDLIAEYSFKINKLLSDYLKDLNIELIDYKIEFGKPPTAPSSWRTRFLRIPAVSGTAIPVKSWTKTVSAEIWVMWRAHIMKS